MKKKDNILLQESKKWTFDKEVAGCFDNMLERSIPQYSVMRELTASLGFRFVQDGSNIVDMECSNGNAVMPFVEKFANRNKYYLYDVSEPMLDIARKKYKKYIDMGTVAVDNFDIKNGIEVENCSLVLSVLTLQFTPIEYRQRIVDSVYRHLNRKGAFILVEKVLGNDFESDKMLVNEYYKMKSKNCYTQEQIERKRKSLEGVLVPITSKWNEELLRSCRFRVELFWRCLNFAGWIAIKD